MADSSCVVQIDVSGGPSGGGGSVNAVTVGQIFELRCDGDWSQLSSAPLVFKLGEADQHKIHLLSVQADGRGALLKVTSYVAGQHKLSPLSITAKGQEQNLKGVEFQVISVLDPKGPPPEPFGPRGPLGLSLPLWYYLIWIFVGLAVLTAVGIRIRRWRHKQKLIADLEGQSAAIDPFAQFNQSLRRLQRQFSSLTDKQEVTVQDKENFIKELEKSYRTFIGRSFLIPTFAWKDRTILQELKTADKKVYIEEGEVIGRLFEEFLKGKEQIEKVKNQDLQQLLELARKNVDKIFVIRGKNEKSALRRGRR